MCSGSGMDESPPVESQGQAGGENQKWTTGKESENEDSGLCQLVAGTGLMQAGQPHDLKMQSPFAKSNKMCQ